MAPPLLYAETTAVLRRYVHLDRIEHQEAIAALRDLFALPLTVIHNPDLYLRALELARRLGQPKAYDVQYLAVAQLEDSTLVTLDRDLYRNALTLGVDAQLLV